jgi:peptidoglycan hydrolase FlgJ
VDTSASHPVRSSTADQRFALDVRGLDDLRRAARQSPEEGLRQVSRQFEAMFMGMLLKSMRDATPASGLLDSQGGKMYLSLLDQQLAQNLSGRGLRLADALFAQLRRGMAASAEATPSDAGRSASGGERKTAPLPPGAVMSAVRAAADAAPQALAAPIRTPTAAPAPLPALPPLVASTGATAAAAPPPEPAREGIAAAVRTTVERFVARVSQAADAAAAATGVPAVLIVAQAALESGWGRREITTQGGAPSFNLFGIKADRSWTGPVAEASTTEYVDGILQRVRAKFRAYGSYEEAFADYARFLASHPRYARVLGAADPVQAAHGLQRAGYATDPQYGSKLVRIIQRLL